MNTTILESDEILFDTDEEEEEEPTTMGYLCHKNTPNKFKNSFQVDTMVISGVKITIAVEDCYVRYANFFQAKERGSFSSYYDRGNSRWAAKVLAIIANDPLFARQSPVWYLRGGEKKNNGDWAHPLLAINAFSWISKEFGVQLASEIKRRKPELTSVIDRVLKIEDWLQPIDNTPESLPDWYPSVPPSPSPLVPKKRKFEEEEKNLELEKKKLELEERRTKLVIIRELRKYAFN